jgi:hypothetical protein
MVTGQSVIGLQRKPVAFASIVYIRLTSNKPAFFEHVSYDMLVSHQGEAESEEAHICQ